MKFLMPLCLWATLQATGAVSYFGVESNDEYATWFESRGAQYPLDTFLASPSDPNDGMAVHWVIKDDTIRLAVVAKATGWLGFGIAESGGMKGSDIVLFDAKTKSLVDSHVLGENVMPIPDDCQSWELIQSTVGDEFLIAEFTRAIDSNDTQDHRLNPDGNDYQPATRVIAAWGDSDTPEFHGGKHAKGSLRFFADPNASGSPVVSFRSAIEVESEGSFTVGASNYTVPSNQDTTYVNFCVTYDQLEEQGVLNSTEDKKHIIGFESFIDPRAARHVHHFLFYGTTNPGNYECDDAPELELLYIWAPGSQPFMPPPQVGVPLAGPGGYLSFFMEVHYDNPDLISGIVDSSGVRVYYTSEVRDYDQGVLSVGDPSVDASPSILSVNGGLTQHSFYCPSDCTQNYFREEVTVYTEILHMHENGRTMQNQQIRNGQIVRRGVSQFYDFPQQGGFEVVQEPFQILPGDAFNVVCGFDAEAGERWGLASSDEMCIGFLYYYPRQLIEYQDDTGPGQLQPLCGVGFEDFLPGCGVDHRITPDFTAFERDDREFGLPPAKDTCASGSGSWEDDKKKPSGGASTSSSILVVLYLPLLATSLQIFSE